MKQIEVGLPEPLIARVDALRGDVTRSAWLRRQIEARVEFFERWPPPTSQRTEDRLKIITDGCLSYLGDEPKEEERRARTDGD